MSRNGRGVGRSVLEHTEQAYAGVDHRAFDQHVVLQESKRNSYPKQPGVGARAQFLWRRQISAVSELRVLESANSYLSM